MPGEQLPTDAFAVLLRVTEHRCPKCGSSVLTDERWAWCAWVECPWGTDPPVRLGEIEGKQTKEVS